MDERIKHVKAFEYYLLLGAEPVDRVMEKVARGSGVSLRTVWRWYKNYGWRKRAEERKNEVALALSKETDKAIQDVREGYLQIIHELVDIFKQNILQGTVKMGRVEDFERVVKLGRLLQDQPTGDGSATINIITAVPRPGGIQPKLPPLPKARAPMVER